MKENWTFERFYRQFYEGRACGLGRAAGGDISSGTGINGDETVFGAGGLLLFEELRAVGSLFGQA
jgi:hypothetical protein